MVLPRDAETVTPERAGPGKRVLTPAKEPQREGPRCRRRIQGLRSALQALVKQGGGREDIEFADAPKLHTEVIAEVPITERAGYPLVRAEGSADPAEWTTNDGFKVMVDFSRHWWLPDDWAQGVKPTKRTSHSTGTSGGSYTVIRSPDGKTFYHRADAEAYAGKKFTAEMARQGQLRRAQLEAKEYVQLARRQIKEVDGGGGREHIGFDSDETLFDVLAADERRFVAAKDAFHFCVISGRRASKLEGIRDIFMVQTQLLDAGVTPTWYVDEESLPEYQALGLQAVVGGKLTPARNRALEDASRLGKVCVQLSDDISAWEYRDGANAAEKDDKLMNAAHAAARRLIVSPVAAARFILAKMRGAPEERKPKLGGVYMLGSCARTFASDAFSRRHFILGDFFVVDVGSEVRFDSSMTLKEDYDFTCAHIHENGSVLRCNRLTLSVKHYSNAGGACANRDKKGLEERKNIDILEWKWPRVFRANPKRKNEVVMSWPKDGVVVPNSGVKRPGKGAAAEDGGVAPSPGGKRPGQGAATKAGVKKSVLKRSVEKARKQARSQPEPAEESGAARAGPAPEAKQGAKGGSKLAPSAVLNWTGKCSKLPYIAARCRAASGMCVSEVVGAFKFRDANGGQRVYGRADLMYDLRCGFISAE